jgi:hypothetical protein
MSAELALQKALYDLWIADAGVQLLVDDKVFDAVPDRADYPFVQLGETQAIDEDVGCGPRLEVFLTVHVWSRKPGFVECKKIMEVLRSTVRTAMEARSITLEDGHKLQELRHEQSRTLSDTDGKTSHGVVTFLAVID